MIYRVRHVTRYDYKAAADGGSHLAHLRPRPLPFQRVLSASLTAEPTPSWQNQGTDHFGNTANWMFLDIAHRSFVVTAEAQVDVRFPDLPQASATPPWEDVAAAAANAWQAAEFLFDSPLVGADPEARAYAASSFPPRRPVLDALLELNLRIHRDFTFRAGVTTTSTKIHEVLERREGVCQDFTHLMISALRALGLPARYASGYIRTRPKAGGVGRLGADQSHAWVGCWLGAQHGWVDLDPTNGLVVQEEHVLLGWGRDYSDVAPLRGVILSGGEHRLSVEVELRPVT
ncbi:MAG TPA: transglutaminase family protein [Acetobacteraceae bacterium]|jgi:transglutaminase-like putative cysteine protease